MNKPHKQKYNFPSRDYYTVEQAAEILGCHDADLIHWAAIGAINLCAYVTDFELCLDVDKFTYTVQVSTSHIVAIQEKEIDAHIIRIETSHTDDAAIPSVSGLLPIYRLDVMHFECTNQWPEDVGVSISAGEDFIGNGFLDSPPVKLFIIKRDFERLLSGEAATVVGHPAPMITTEQKGVRDDGRSRVIAALACGYLGSTEAIESKAGEIIRTLSDTQDKGGLTGLRLPDEKTLRGYLQRAAEQMKREFPPQTR